MVRRSMVEASEVRIIMWKLVNALAHMEHNGVIHRDIKPQNIVIEEGSMETVIVDYGMCSYDRMDLQNTNVCTPRYLAPDIIAALANYDNRVDVWSLGLTMYQIDSINFVLFPKMYDVEESFRSRVSPPMAVHNGVLTYYAANVYAVVKNKVRFAGMSYMDIII